MSLSLDATKFVGNDEVSPRILKFCAQPFCDPPTILFCMICHHTDIPST